MVTANRSFGRTADSRSTDTDRRRRTSADFDLASDRFRHSICSSVFRELWAAYATKLEGKEQELPALPVQYADFAEWQRRRYSGQIFQSQREYWIQRLSGSHPVLNLPADEPRPPVQGFNGSRLPVQLPHALQLKLKEISREYGVTLFTTLLAAFKVLLYRYTTQEDLLVGCPVLNRGLPETENLSVRSSTRWCCTPTMPGIRVSETHCVVSAKPA